MKKIEDIKNFCKNPTLVNSEGMSLTEISMALGITYSEVKYTFESAMYKLGKILKTSDESLVNDLKYTN